MSLTEFLTARLDEDEAVAREAHYDGQRWFAEEEVVNGDVEYGPTLVLDRKCDALHAARWSPARVLAEVEAKRRIVGARAAIGFPEGADIPEGQGPVWLDGAHVAVAAERDRTLRLLALPYVDHPDYDEAWRV